MQAQSGGQRPVDPYFAWAVASGFADYGSSTDDTFFTVLAECPDHAGVWALNTALKAWAGNAAGALAYVTPAYLAAPASAQAGTYLPTRFCTLHVQRKLLDTLPSLTDVVRWEIGAPVKVKPLAGSHVDAAGGLNQSADAGLLQGVVAALIDDFVAFNHSEFLAPDGSSRVAWLWDQNHTLGALVSGGQAPLNFTYGKEARPNAIPSAGQVRPTYTSAALRRAYHGTAVAGQFCGKTSPWHRLTRFDPSRPPEKCVAARDAASDAPVVAVHLPRETVKDTSGSSLPPQILDGLHYILSKCHSDARIVVNISYGGIAGPHDGTSLLEMAIRELVEQMNHRLLVVLPIGNSREAMCHARLCLKPGQPESLAWKLAPDSDTPSFMEIWFPDDDVDGVSISLTAPDGLQFAREVGPGAVQALLHPATGHTVGMLQFDRISALGLNRAMALLVLAPTQAAATRPGISSHGLWQVEIQSKTRQIDNVQVWIERNDTAPGQRSRRRQSRLSVDGYNAFGQTPGLPVDTPAGRVKRSGTTSNIASSLYAETIGGYRLSDLTLAAYSSGGHQPQVRGPFALAPSEESTSLRGLRVIGQGSGDSHRMAGTSLAAPIWARFLFNEFAANRKPPTSRAIQSVEVATSSVEAASGSMPLMLGGRLVIYPDPDKGFGMFDPRP